VRHTPCTLTHVLCPLRPPHALRALHCGVQSEIRNLQSAIELSRTTQRETRNPLLAFYAMPYALCPMPISPQPALNFRSEHPEPYPDSADHARRY
jgi:hypothetical protein